MRVVMKVNYSCNEGAGHAGVAWAQFIMILASWLLTGKDT